jgi:hypothetical protein
MLPSLQALLSRFRPPRKPWLGRAYRVTIAPAACGGYVMRIHHTQGTDWVDLPLRMEEYDRPDEREFTVAAAALAERGLTWVLPWQLGTNGVLTAPVTTLASPQPNPLADPGTTGGTETTP